MPDNTQTVFSHADIRNMTAYDYFYEILQPPVQYGQEFRIHINSSGGAGHYPFGAVTSKKENGGIKISPEGYSDFQSGVSSYRIFDALNDYNEIFGGPIFSFSSKKEGDAYYDFVASTLGGRVMTDKEYQEYIKKYPDKAPDFKSSTKRASLAKTTPPTKNLFKEFKEKAAEQMNKRKIYYADKPVVVKETADGRTDVSVLSEYLLQKRGLSADTIGSLYPSLIYLTPAPIYRTKKGKDGKPIVLSDGTYDFIRDAGFKKQFLSLKNPKTGEWEQATKYEFKEMPDGSFKKEYLYNIAFCSKDTKNHRAFFERKGIGSAGGSFIAEGSSPYGYFSFTGTPESALPNVEGADPHRRAYICEAPIDALSLYELHKLTGEITEPTEYIAISGAGKALAVQRAILEGFDCVLAFDNDEVGLRHMNARNAQYKNENTGSFTNLSSNNTRYTDAQGVQVSLPSIVPPKLKWGTGENAKETKDWNDLLKVYKNMKDSRNTIVKCELLQYDAKANCQVAREYDVNGDTFREDVMKSTGMLGFNMMPLVRTIDSSLIKPKVYSTIKNRELGGDTSLINKINSSQEKAKTTQEKDTER